MPKVINSTMLNLFLDMSNPLFGGELVAAEDP